MAPHVGCEAKLVEQSFDRLRTCFRAFQEIVLMRHWCEPIRVLNGKNGLI